MRKDRRWLAGIFAAGILISGIGAGIGVTEFMSLEYVGEKTIGETENAVLEGEIQFTPSSENEILPLYLHYGQEVLDLKLDESVPENVLKYKIEYNKKAIEPEVWQNEDGIGFHFLEQTEDQLKLIMELRTEVMDDLKEHKIGSYERKRLESIEVYINPKNSDRIQLW